MPKSPSPKLTKKNFKALAELRHALRGFLKFSREAATAAGIPPQQHQALLALKGFTDRSYLTVGELAERLDLQHHSAVGLVDRLAKRRLVRRTRAPEDRRRVRVELTAQGEALIDRLSSAHLEELRQIGPKLRAVLEML